MTIGKNDILTYEEANEKYRIDPYRGLIFFKPLPDNHKDSKRFNKRYAGTLAFRTDNGKHYRGQVGHDKSGYKMYAHRLMWLLYYGEYPDGEIDHINRNGHDNRISNLRVVDKSGNQRNANIPRNNKTGVKGVSWDNTRNAWRAAIRNNEGKQINKYHKDIDVVIAWRKQQELTYGGYYV